MQSIQIENTINELFEDSKKDYLRIIKGAAKSLFRPIVPSDFKDAYLSISKEQGDELVRLIEANKMRSVVEFGTSFGISTLYLAKGISKTGGNITTTELIESKALKAIENFKLAGVDNLIEVKIGDALDTLKNYTTPIDLLLLDGWKDLYFPVFKLLEKNYHSDTIIYVDNADMEDSQIFLQLVSRHRKYKIEYKFQGKVALIRINSNQG